MSFAKCRLSAIPGVPEIEFTHYRVLMLETWWEYVDRISGGAEQKTVAEAAGITAGQVSRWSDGHNPNAKNVIQFARHYGRPPTEALVAAGYMNQDEVAGISILDVSVRGMSSDALAREIGGLVRELRRRIPGTDQGQDWGEGDAEWVGNPQLQQHPAMRRRQG